MKKNKIVFHIGTHKTGSTALQKFLLTNESVLTDNNFIYYPCNNKINHMDLSHNIELWDSIELDPKVNYIFSSEDFFSRFNQSKAEPSIVEILIAHKEKFKSFNIEVIVYLREQADYIQSVYNELIKRHGYFKPINEKIVGINYLERLNKISELKIKPKIIVRPYSPSKFIGGSIFSDFIACIAFENKSHFYWEDKYINNALPIKPLTFMKHINACKLDKGLLVRVGQTVISLYANEDGEYKNNSESFLSIQSIKNIQLSNEYQNKEISDKYLDNMELFTDVDLKNNAIDKINELDALDEVIEILSKKHIGLLKDVYVALLSVELDSEISIRSQARLLLRLSIITSLSLPKDKISLLNLHAGDLNEFLVADLLREISLYFEGEDKFEVAFELLSKAKKLRPDGVVINDKLDTLKGKVEKSRNKLKFN